jgi:hypothetical protein
MADHEIRVEEKEGGYLFHLRHDVKLLCKWHSDKTLQVELWRNDAMLPPDLGTLYASAFRQRLLNSAGPVLFPSEPRDEALKALEEDLGHVAIMLNTATASGSTLHAQLGAGRSGPTVTERLVRYARKGADFFHTPDRRAHAAIKVGSHVEHHRMDGREFGLWVRHEYWKAEKKRLQKQAQAIGGALYDASDTPLPDVVRERDLSDCLRLLQGFALFEGPEAAVYRRIAEHEGDMFVDLCDEDWRVIRVTKDGWRIMEGHEAPVKFARKPGMLPLPEPEDGGSLEPLRELLHLGHGELEERNWLLICGWLVQALTTDGAYTILTLLGNQGSAKSATQRVLRNLVDRNLAPIRSKPREERDVFVAAENSWLISLDNMSKISEWLSNALCTIVYHGGFGLRMNYTDDDEVLFNARRPCLINGIGDILTYPDLLDRAAIVKLPPFESDPDAKRLSDDEVDAQVESITPSVFGALLSCVSHYLTMKDSIPNPDTRMVAYAKVGIAVEHALGFEEGSFMRAYLVSRGDANATALESYPISAVLIKYAQDYPPDDPWEGTAQELLNDLNSRAGETLRRADDWPTNPSQLGTQLNRLATNLQREGVQFERLDRAHGGIRLLRITYHGKVEE